MRLNYFKKGFNYSQDGPGNRLVYHLIGCNMMCPWCANPEGLGVNSTNPTQYYSEELDVILEEILSCKSLFFEGGGVTFTGGEATLQYIELLTLLKELNKLNIHTAIETNATSKQLVNLFPYIDYLIMDFKHIDDKIHQKFTGISNSQIKLNIAQAMKSHPNVLIRTPLINGFNANSKYISQFISFFQQFPLRNTSFEFLKYHEYGKRKWEEYGLTYTYDNGFVDDELAILFETEYKKNGLTIVHT